MREVASRRQLTQVLLFSGAYLSVAAIYIVKSRNNEFLLYLMVMMAIIVAVLGIYKRAGLGPHVMWGFSFWGVLHIIGGLVPIPPHWHLPDTSAVVYNWRVIPGYVKYDQLVHGIGVGLVTWLCWQALASRLRGLSGEPIRPTLGMLGICTAAGMGFGALNEVIEFFASMMIPHHNIGDYRNTGWDLVANLIGACFTAFAIRFVWQKAEGGE
ncbi:MAG: DUF2238 domain-containing protein [Verrucomicrobiales bacterium]|nr:DUF2238 domain-containing protein [Verrucomicrobiales bacterium]